MARHKVNEGGREGERERGREGEGKVGRERERKEGGWWCVHNMMDFVVIIFHSAVWKSDSSLVGRKSGHELGTVCAAASVQPTTKRKTTMVAPGNRVEC